MPNPQPKLETGAFYHIYNRANGSEKMFLSDDNYYYFLRRFQYFVLPVAKVYCYCLMPNHFHFLLQIRDENETIENLRLHQIITENRDQTTEIIERHINLQFSKFFNSYAKAFNKQQSRKGSVFMKSFKRKIILDHEYLFYLVKYIHLNPVEARLCSDPGKWKHSSYRQICGSHQTWIERKKVIEWFDEVAEMIRFHSTPLDEKLGMTLAEITME